MLSVSPVRFELLKASPVSEVVDFLLCSFFFIAIWFLQNSNELFSLAGDDRQFVIGEFSPLLFDFAGHLFPVAFDLIPSSSILLLIRLTT